MTNSNNQKKTTILAAGRKLFFMFGFSKTSMDDIARECGLAKPTLYYYFPNKEAIFNEIVINEAELFIDRIEKQLPPNLPADKKLSEFFLKAYEGLKNYESEVSDLPEVMYREYPHGQPIVERICEILKQKIKPILLNGQKNGVFTATLEESMLSAIVLMTDFLNLKWMKRMAGDKRDAIVEKAIDIILNGIRRRS